MTLLRRRLAGKALSRPELDVLRAAADGLSAIETAERLFKSKHTIVTQRRSLQAKLGARNLPHAVALAYELRLLGRNPPERQWPARDERVPVGYGLAALEPRGLEERKPF